METVQKKLCQVLEDLKEAGKQISFRQLDLEEEIERIKNQNKPTMQIVWQEVVRLFNDGYSRYKKDDEGKGSIQEKYNLTNSQVKELFQHPKLKNIKRKPPALVILDENEINDSNPPSREIPSVLRDETATTSDSITTSVTSSQTIPNVQEGPVTDLFN